MNLSIKKYYIFCYRNRRILKKKISNFSKETDEKKKIALSFDIMDFAERSGAGYYTISEIEDFYIKLAHSIDTIEDGIFYPNSYLHVMTTAYTTGGHSRVVARWIETSPEEQKHSLVLLNQGNNEIPQDIQTAVASHGGDIYVSSNQDLLENARYLRKLSLQYKGIILHIHPKDPTSIIAYGVNTFKTPILMFNHADHNYWCGASIVDVIADIRDNGISQKYRNIDDVYVLRIPIESNFNLNKYINAKSSSRLSLGIAQDVKVILTIGRSAKYKSIGNIEFCNVIYSVLQQVPSSICYGIGPTEETGFWGNTPKCVPLGEIAYGEEYYKYLAAADLYVDSLPIGGGVAIMDAIQAHLPVLSYSVFNPDFGSLVEGVTKISKKKEFLELAVSLLLDSKKSEALACQQYKTMMKYHGTRGWNAKKEDIISILKGKKHSVKKIRNISSSIDDRCVMLGIKSIVTDGDRKIQASNIFSRVMKKIIYYFINKI